MKSVNLEKFKNYLLDSPIHVQSPRNGRAVIFSQLEEYINQKGQVKSVWHKENIKAKPTQARKKFFSQYHPSKN